MENNKLFESILNQDWKPVLRDSGKNDWQELWTLDGKNSRVYNHKEHGMEIYAGARLLHDPDHTVLWTKEEFSGDIKISYEFTRLDNAEKCVNIIYLMARGSGEAPYTEDISEWAHLREVPSMHTYFNHMNSYHISYAAFGMDIETRYIRARRYRCCALQGTEMAPDYDPDDFFAPMVPHQLTFIKKGNMMFFHVKNPTREKLCSWELSDGGELNTGRIGLRQMFTRYSRYKNIEISML